VRNALRIAEAEFAPQQLGLIDARWQARAKGILDTLEHEARRLITLELELSDFAERFCAALFGPAERYFESQASGLLSDAAAIEELSALAPAARFRRQRRAREDETRQRYRGLQAALEALSARDEEVDTYLLARQISSAYAAGDLPRLLRLEAETLMLAQGPKREDMDLALPDIARAAQTYATATRELLRSHLNGLMLREIAAQQTGVDWLSALVLGLERACAA
jgi:hypothetical protein